jgi:hypothetical protein
MSLVASRVNLTHRCVIERDVNAGDTDDGWGNPSPPDWRTHLVAQPCRVWATVGQEVVANTTTVVPVEDVRLIVPLGTDVTEADRVAAVTDRGAIVQVGPLQIRAVLARQDHLELVLFQVK